jgi:hypothetical protein
MSYSQANCREKFAIKFCLICGWFLS